MEKEIIIRYLQGPRDPDEGITIVLRYSKNRALVTNLRRNMRASSAMSTVIDELRRMAGLSVVQLSRLPRYASGVQDQLISEPRNVQDHQQLQQQLDDMDNELEEKRQELDEKDQELEEVRDELDMAQQLIEDLEAQLAPDSVQRTITFREQFPFLNSPDCPDVLKILVSDMFTAYARYKEDHAKLSEVADAVHDDETERLSASVVDNYVENRDIWAELVHYRDTGQLLGQHRKVRLSMEQNQLERMTDVELHRALMSARSNVSKQKNRVLAGGDAEKIENAKKALNKWEIQRQAVENEIERRKH